MRAPHLVLSATLACAVFAAPSALGAHKVAVTPPQGEGLEAIQADLEEAVRAGVLERAPALELLVMSHATMLAQMKALNIAQEPCAAVECDVAHARQMGTELVVSSKVARLDGDAVLVLKLLSTADGKLVAQKMLTAPKTAALLDGAQALAVTLVDAGLAGAARHAADATRLIRTGYVAVLEDGDLMAMPHNCSLYGDRLACRQASIALGTPEAIDVVLKDVASVFAAQHGVGIALRNGRTYKLVPRAPLRTPKQESRMTSLERMQEAAILEGQAEQWRADLERAIADARG
ncbi:MAG: hypothetical protein IT382_11280 [Deltaproteobacteria bacterium]|nr:hypothetical protein [Deltaproteobacteria bacterium]